MFKLIVLFGALALTAAKLKSPCPVLFQYLSEQPGQIEASVTFYSDADLQGVWARFIFDSPVKQLEVSNNYGQIDTKDNFEFLLHNRNHTLHSGVAEKIRLYIKYEGAKVPKLVAFRLNARTVCPEHGEDFKWIDGDRQVSNEYFLGDLNNKNFLSSRPEPEATSGCGRVPLFPKDVSGSENGEGRWPWQASIYLLNNNKQKLVCGATLISPNHILTAAHCVTRKNSEIPVYPNTLKIRLGEYFLNNQNRGLQERSVIDVSIHPAYNPINLDNNLAIIKLEEAVKIEDYVRPICLWEEPLNTQAIARQEGYVVGYGFDEDGHYTDRITHAKLKVVSTDVCLNSKPELTSYLSQNSMCVAYVRGNPICVGESGSGVAVLRDGTNPIYQLAGVVSVGAALQNKLICDDSNYIVLSDLSKHYQWIKITVASP